MKLIISRKSQSGLTLIELMIVIAIIGLLAAIAIPAYNDYAVRAQVSEGLALAGGSKTAIAEYFDNYAEFPTTNQEAGLALPTSISGNYVGSIDVSEEPGVIRITYGPVAGSEGGQKANAAIVDGQLDLSAVTSAGSVSWSCHSTSGVNGLYSRYLPSNCR